MQSDNLDSDYSVESLRQPFDHALQDQVDGFLAGLVEERATFQLSSKQIANAVRLYVAQDADNQLLALAGLRTRILGSVLFLVVKQQFQGKGLGKRLMKSVMQEISPWKLVMLSVQGSNQRAISLYEQWGFATVLIEHQTYFMLYRNFTGIVLQPAVLALLKLTSLWRSLVTNKTKQ